MKLPGTLSLLCCFQLAAFCESSFADKCHDIKLKDTSGAWMYLEAWCTKEDGSGESRCSQMNLNHCFGVNDDHFLIQERLGDFGAHCQSCEVDNGQYLDCECQTNEDKPDEEPKWVKSSIDMDLTINIKNDKLTCFSIFSVDCT
ncbi:hypothetical protein BJ170DRAFT_595973 [Xylariales sp. AK1849]|nr:hypothetical protein BJ170DRAFT_595973 [Xylariales sp. AK1849]